MKKLFFGILIFVLVAPIVLIMGLKLGWSTLVEPKIKTQIQDTLAQSGFQTQIRKIRLKSWLLPIEIEMGELKSFNQETGVEITLPRTLIKVVPQSLGTSLQTIKPKVDMLLQKPKITMTPPEAVEGDEKASANSGETEAKALTPMPVSLGVNIFEGEITYNAIRNGDVVSLTNLKSQLFIPQLMGLQPILLQLDSKVNYELQSLPFPIKGSSPLKVEAKKTVFSGKQLTINDLVVDFGGLQVNVSGEKQIGSNSSAFLFETKIKSLATLQQGGLLPPGKWLGGIDGTFEYKTGPTPTPRVSGHLKFNKVSGRLAKAIKNNDAQVAGGFATSGSLRFFYGKKLENLTSNIAVNLKPLSLYKKDLFYKKVGVPFSLRMKSELKNNFIELSQFSLQMAQIKASASGKVALKEGDKSQLQFNVPKTNLKGLEKQLLPLKKYPVQGSLAVTGQVEGDLADPENLSLTANPLSLQVSTGIDYKNEESGLSLSGPVSSTVNGSFKIVKQDIQSADLKGRANLTSMAMALSNGLEKKKGENLSFNFSGKKKGQVFNIESFTAKTFIGEIAMKGTLSNPLKPKLNLAGRIDGVSLGKLKKVFKAFSALPVEGKVKGQIQLSGTFDNQLGIEGSALSLKGKVLHNSSLLKWDSPQPEPGKKQSRGEENKTVVTKDLKPLLPNWPVVKTADIGLNSKIKKVIFNDLEVNHFALVGRLNKGILTGQMDMEQVFKGKIQLKNIRSDLYKVPTYIDATAVTEGLDLKSAVTWGVPAQKDLIKGSMNGGFKVRTPFPSHGDPFTKTQSSGALKINGFEMSTLQLDQMINGLIAKIPGLKGKKKVKTNDVKALFQSQYSFKDGVLNFTKTNFLTPENHQLVASGSVKVDKSLAMKGELFVSGVKVKQSLETCLLDKQKRLPVPIEYQGLITEPKMTYAAKAIEKLGGKYLDCEKRVQMKKVETKAKKKAQETLKSEGKKIEDKLKDKLKDIF